MSRLQNTEGSDRVRVQATEGCRSVKLYIFSNTTHLIPFSFVTHVEAADCNFPPGCLPQTTAKTADARHVCPSVPHLPPPSNGKHHGPSRYLELTFFYCMIIILSTSRLLPSALDWSLHLSHIHFTSLPLFWLNVVVTHCLCSPKPTVNFSSQNTLCGRKCKYKIVCKKQLNTTVKQFCCFIFSFVSWRIASSKSFVSL